jgi:ankyrin repeat protein
MMKPIFFISFILVSSSGFASQLRCEDLFGPVQSVKSLGEFPTEFSAQSMNYYLNEVLLANRSSSKFDKEKGKNLFRSLFSNPALNINARNANGRTILMEVVSRIDLLDYAKLGLLNKEEKMSAIKQILSRSQLIINEQDPSGKTALHLAAGNENVSKDLLEVMIRQFGADIMAKDLNGNSIIHTVLMENQNSKIAREKVELLLKLEPRLLYERNANGETILASALKARHVDLFKSLYELPSADKYAVDKSGNSLLMVAATSRATVIRDVTSYLLADKDTRINQKNDAGDTALHLSVRADDGQNLLSILLSHPDADPFIKNNAGRSVFDEAYLIHKDKQDRYKRAASFNRLVWDPTGVTPERPSDSSYAWVLLKSKSWPESKNRESLLNRFKSWFQK